MKTYIRLLLLCLLGGFFAHQAIGSVINLIPPGGWKGEGGKATKSMTILPLVSASIESSLLHIQCVSPVVDVTVCILQNGITVYQEAISAADTNHIWIDLSGYVAGVYTLDLTNSTGGHVYGDFNLNTSNANK